MDMGHFIQAIEVARLKEGIEPSIGGHRFVLGLPGGGILVCSSDAKVAAGGGIPPKHQGIGIVLS